MTSWKGYSITWTSYNYPTHIVGPSSSNETYTYGPGRQPWLDVFQDSSGTTDTYHLGNLMSIVERGGGITYRHYIYAGREPVAIDARTSSGNTFYYLLTDHQGSIAGITNSAGQVVINESFQAYGGRRNPSTWTTPISASDLDTIATISPRGYTFKPTIEHMELTNLGGRVEDAFTGRFLSADPNITDPTDPQSYNRYSYTINNPLTYTDPSGFDYTTDPQDNDSGGGGGGDYGVTVKAKPLPPSFCGSNIFCVANTYGGAGVLENRLYDPQYLGHLLGAQYASGGSGQQGATPQQQSNPDDQLQPVTVTATKCCASVYDPPLVPSLIGVDDLAGVQLSWSLNRIGCTGKCQVLATVVVSALAPEASEGTAIEETTTLYRAVSQAEYDDIMESGMLRAVSNSFESGKWFAESPEDAIAWGNALEGPGNFRVIQVQFPSSVADQFFSLDSLDGIGPARFGTFDQIGNPTISLWTGP